MVQPVRKTVWRFLKKLKIELPYDLAIPLLGINPEKNYNSKRHMHPSVHGNTVYDSQTGKQPRCPLTNGWIKKMWHM